ncbi:TIGR02757 family protein [Croceitalea rosinachiae]|uniref:TIGR02757 family protein n=1 Tax=Croceitalea rosinachiae TaxID=3075596 RepID=A0ABU3AB74_9FLAO|nr:TIGR02757 family protein [Croceitalea sp. F388]MDT0607436.1 TIGR02757 family protein [Croceitalea sp. F388]
MTKAELKEFLDEKAEQYEHPKFLEADPIQIPHRFTIKEDIEISAFLTATIAWGNRKSIINNASRMMEMLDNAPYDFIKNHKVSDLDSLASFVHRTFNGDDFQYFVKALKNIYSFHGGLESLFKKHQKVNTLQPSISKFKEVFFEIPHQKRTTKHVSNPLKGSAAKRINMFLRWMVRPSDKGVDFGLWKGISPSLLSCPLDVHSGNVARKLKLLKRKQNDAKSLTELDKNLRKFDAKDPVKYDFALFGLGVFEKF